MGPSILFPGLPLNENTRRTIAQRIRALFAGSVEGAWYDPSDMSTMFQSAPGLQTPVTATAQNVGLILDKSKGLALSSPLSINGDFSSNGSGWGVVNSDGTHIVTWGNPGMRFQSDTTTPQLTVTRTGALTSGQWYKVTVVVSAVIGTGPIRLSGAFSVQIPNSVGSHTIYWLSSSANLNFTRDSTDVDTTIASVQLEPIAGNHAWCPSSGFRPIFRDVGGVRYLEFDGVDDYLRATFTIAQPIDRISALRQVTWTEGDQLFAGATLDAGVLFQSGPTPRINTYSWGGALYPPSSPAVGVNNVVTERHAGANSRIAVGSGTYTTGDTGSSLPGGVTIGASHLGTVPANMHLHQLIMRGGPTALTDTQITLLRKVCYAAAGLPFPGYEETEVSRMFSSIPTAEGAWYDPSDLSTMFTDSGGGTQVNATGQTVGLLLDKRLGLQQAASAFVNGTFLSDLTGWTVGVDATQVIPTWDSPGKVIVVRGAGSLNGFSQAFTTVSGTWYKATCSVKTGSPSGLTCSILAGAAPTGAVSCSSGETKSFYFLATAASCTFNCWSTSNNATGWLESVSIVSVAGNHAYQTTSGSRPIFRDVGGLRYLEFDGVDDYLRAAFTIAQPIDRISAIQQASWTNADYVYDGVTANTGILYQLAGSPSLRIYSGTPVVMTPDLAVATSGVVTERHDGASSRVALNNNAYVTGNAGANLPGGLTIGASFSPAYNGNIFLHQLIMRGSTTAMTDAQIAACRALCAVKSGVTL